MIYQVIHSEVSLGDYTGGPVLKNPPCNAGDMGSNPGEGTKIPHAVDQLSPQAATAELMNSRACGPPKILHAPQHRSCMLAKSNLTKT